MRDAIQIGRVESPFDTGGANRGPETIAGDEHIVSELRFFLIVKPHHKHA